MGRQRFDSCYCKFWVVVLLLAKLIVILTTIQVFSCIQTALVFYEVHLGLGNRKIFDRDSGENNMLEKVQSHLEDYQSV